MNRENKLRRENAPQLTKHTTLEFFVCANLDAEQSNDSLTFWMKRKFCLLFLDDNTLEEASEKKMWKASCLLENWHFALHLLKIYKKRSENRDKESEKPSNGAKVQYTFWNRGENQAQNSRERRHQCQQRDVIMMRSGCQSKILKFFLSLSLCRCTRPFRHLSPSNFLLVYIQKVNI